MVGGWLQGWFLLPVICLCLAFFPAPGSTKEMPEYSGGPKQERNNRMVPDFKPFHHPSEKIDSSSGLFMASGPIASVHWLELVPVFGALYKAPDQKNKSSSLVYILGLGAGSCCLAGYFYNKNSGQQTEYRAKENTKNQQQKHENHNQETRRTEGQGVQSESRGEEDEEDRRKRNAIEERRKRLAREQENERRQQKEMEERRRQQEKELEEKRKKEEVEQRKEELDAENKRKQKEIAEEKERKEASEKKKNDEATLKIIKKPTTTVKKKDRKVSYAKEEEAYNTKCEDKAKGFKMTKVPKTHNCSSTEHGVQTEVLTVEEVQEVERTEKLNTTIQTFLPNINIEGANISRLRITDVIEKNDEEFVAKTMTIKEYMMSFANKKIEEAVKRVKEDCSLANIQNLAETIKKYRPESNCPNANGL